MTIKRSIRGVVAIPMVLTLASPALAADAVPCAGPHVNSAVTVNVAGATAARIYFRKQGTTDWYFIDLKSGTGGFFGVLPVLEPGTNVEYDVETTDLTGKKQRTGSTTLSPSPSCAPTLSEEQATMASNLIVGKGSDTARDIPEGFDCNGMVGVLSPQGELKTVKCKGKSIIVPVAVGAAAVGGGILIYDNNRPRHRAASESRP